MIADPSMRRRDERLKGQGKHKAKPDPLALKRPIGDAAPIRLYPAAHFMGVVRPQAA